MKTQQNIYVVSSEGLITADFATGEVTANTTQSYADAERVDINECNDWLASFGQPALTPEASIDCLFIGWWERTGHYSQADAQARADYVLERERFGV